jgi:catechol 2,3-dioxygenase-like lactoylglutathione lyase family enzyme
MLKKIRNLDYVVLLCNDTARMKDFYHETLGFPIDRDWEDWTELRVGSVLLTLRRRGRPYDGEKYPNSAGVQLAFRVAPSEVESCYTELLEKHVEIIEAPRDQDYGHRTLFFNDPEGNILEIYADI